MSKKKKKHDPKVVQEKPAYLRASYSVPPSYVRDEDLEFLPEEVDGNYTLLPSKGLRSDEHGPEERVPADIQEHYTKEAGARHTVLHAEEEARRALRSYMGRIRGLAIEQIKAGRDPSAVFESVLVELAKEDDQKAA